MDAESKKLAIQPISGRPPASMDVILQLYHSGNTGSNSVGDAKIFLSL